MSVRREWWRRECMDVKGCWGESLLLSLPLSSCGAVLALLFLSRPGAGSELSCKPMWFMVWLSLPAGLHFSTHSKGMCSLNFLSSLLFLPTYCRSLLNQLERFNMALLFSGRWPVLAVSRTKALASRLDVITDCSMWATVQYSTLLYYFKVLLCSLTIKHQCLMAAFIMVLLLDTAIKTLWTTSISQLWDRHVPDISLRPLVGIVSIFFVLYVFYLSYLPVVWTWYGGISHSLDYLC